jgi:hypothetical protein
MCLGEGSPEPNLSRASRTNEPTRPTAVMEVNEFAIQRGVLTFIQPNVPQNEV